jgi:hypothetical protein
MPETLRPTNFDALNILEKTELSADVAAGQKVANVINAQGIVADDFYVIGALSAELSELAQLDSKTGNALTAEANYANIHKMGEIVTKLFGNQIKIYRAANVDGSIPADASFVEIATIDIEVDQNFTEYSDATGGANYWYKKTYYNSANTSESSLSSSDAVRGGGYGNYATWEQVREEAGLTNNRYIPAGVYQEKLLSAQGEVNASLRIGGYTLPLTSVPELVKNATILIAAGYVLLKEYGPENTGTNKEGNLKLTEGRKLLAKIEGGGAVLVDNQGASISGSSRIAGYPDDTADDQSPSQGNIFRITDKF